MQEPVSLLIAAIRRRMKQVVGEQVREYGLTPAQFWTLNRVFEQEGLSLRELADSLHMDTPTASRVVAALVRLKYVRSEEDPDDRRRSRIVLSSKGRALADKLRPLAVQIRSAVEAPFTAAERDTLRALLKKSLQHVSRL
ncbi:MAG TPA: MarR family transcriptional regulator [Polyangiales bacterium]|nr:MarR family transcriptional regulator [Polyangiales bacterium]